MNVSTATRENFRGALRGLLLAFVWLTLGFALGKEVTQRRAGASHTTPPASVTTSESQSRVLVYYAHASFRCTTCNTIETLTRQTLETQFAEEMAQGLTEWRTVNFQEDEAFAERYGIVSSCVVVIGMQGDGQTAYQRLDEVWTKLGDPAAFEAYIASAVRELLPQQEGAPE